MHVGAKTSQDTVLVERKVCCHVANAFLGRLKLIYLVCIQAENVQNVLKNALLPKSSECQWVKLLTPSQNVQPMKVESRVQFDQCDSSKSFKLTRFLVSSFENCFLYTA